jgi:hypothetical protein
MKKILLFILIIGLATTATCSIITTNLYKNYAKSTEKLLEDLEIMCEGNDLPWGDTICEGDSWSDYVDACKKLRIEK